MKEKGRDDTKKANIVLAYLVGAMADGYLYHNPKHYIYRVSYYQKLKEYLIKCIESRVFRIFRKRGHFYYDRRKDVYFYEITSKVIFLKMQEATDSFKGDKARRVPSWIRNGNLDVQRAFVQGFFDADGFYAITADSSDFRVRFGQSEPLVLADVCHILSNNGFKCSDVLGPYQSKPNVKPYYELHIHGQQQVLRFHRLIEPCHPEKQLHFEDEN